uniref:Macaca fascicularis brain cDNA clone: QflA-16907, similar to human FLJ45337 protein (FLJ45337), mRNA, RefSeq: NM_207465.1 n=1 Tax=Macaca fascicularis TaxID=9541 RepID=I7G573_MACFA|nr:unnamed protein product [Macaca fascicularis]
MLGFCRLLSTAIPHSLTMSRICFKVFQTEKKKKFLSVGEINNMAKY